MRDPAQRPPAGDRSRLGWFLLYHGTFLRRMISLCVLDREHAHDGRQVTVIWGDRDSGQREIRATVRQLPFKPDNRRIDVNQL
jgi:hypothetical protein